MVRSVALVALDVAAGQVRGVVVRDGDVEEIRTAPRLAVVARGVHGERVRAVSRWIVLVLDGARSGPDRKSTRLNSSHTVISYAVFCLKKKKRTIVREDSLSCR